MTIRYDLDTTGVNSNNLVQAEPHTLSNMANRCFAPDYGSFFSTSMVVTDTANNQVLTRDVQYQCVELLGVPTAMYGKEIMGIVLILDPAVSTSVTCTYQVLGGEWSSSAKAIEQMYNALQLDDRPVAWPAIINKPDGYAPTQHLHDVGDVYGWEYIVDSLERIVRAIELGDALQHQQIYRYIDQLVLENGSLTTGTVAAMIAGQLAAHLAASDPHSQYTTNVRAQALIDASIAGLATADEQFFMSFIG